MGEVYRPEDIVSRRKRRVPDIGPNRIPKPIKPTNLEEIYQELMELKTDVKKIKRALKERGILI